MNKIKLYLALISFLISTISCSDNAVNSSGDLPDQEILTVSDVLATDNTYIDTTDISDETADINNDDSYWDFLLNGDADESGDITEDYKEISETEADTTGSSGDTGYGDTYLTDDAITDISCKKTSQFDYRCDINKPETCPGGLCILNQCVAPNLDPERWNECSDGFCSVCEDDNKCPADCGTSYVFQNSKRYDGVNTITVWVHGFYNKKPEDIKKMVYGKDRGCSGIEERLRFYQVFKPCSDTQEGKLSPEQLTSVEYYGAIPADYLSQKDIEEIEKYPYDKETALHRYALIVAKFIKYKINISGATNVN
ncbi:MAG: hypothetical protein N3B13_07695, partial [Deltaproteobacteria bacterium]|nr:hypothetical protein [Deltaproteobacteria bacterium]